MTMKTNVTAVLAIFAWCSWGTTPGICDDTAIEKLVVTKTMELVKGSDANAFAAYSTTRKKWSVHHFPDFLKVAPFTSSGGADDSEAVIAFDIAGGPIEQLVAVDTKGRFRTHELPKPIDREMRAMLHGRAVIYYIADGVIYAFSGRTGTWDSLVAPHIPDVDWTNGSGTPPSVQEHGFDAATSDAIIVTLPQGTATFSPERGFWKIQLSSSER